MAVLPNLVLGPKRPTLDNKGLLVHLGHREHYGLTVSDWLGFEAAYVLHCVTRGASAGIVCSWAFLRLVGEGRVY
jgi:hypothetical protein